MSSESIPQVAIARDRWSRGSPPSEVRVWLRKHGRNFASDAGGQTAGEWTPIIPSRRHAGLDGWLICLCMACQLFSHTATAAPGSPHEASDAVPFRIGFSSAMFTEVNVNDAKAAIKAWGQTIARERGIRNDPEPRILKNVADLVDALRARAVDAVSVTTCEYAAAREVAEFGECFISRVNGELEDRYVVLVHQQSEIQTIKDLRGRTFSIHLNPRLSLAVPWLDVLLAEKGEGALSGFVGQITTQSKLARVVLPVFFRQIDACIVTLSGFKTMQELNPQLGKQLRILATSAGYVPVVFAFRADVRSAAKDILVAGVRDLHKTPAGKQVLTIFHSDAIECHPVSCLESALELLAEHERLFPGKQLVDSVPGEANRMALELNLGGPQ